MREAGNPMEVSKILFICAVCAVTCLLVLGVTYIAPASQAPSTAHSVLTNPALEDSIYNRDASSVLAQKGMRGKIKATAPWQTGPRF
jgi:hypothetical protein